MLVVTLSTIPPRFHLLPATLNSLLKQTADISAIEVWIPKTYRRFPDEAFVLPDVPEGVTVRVCDEDLGPATKVLPAARAYRGQDVQILYCDDDRIYHKKWAQSFLETGLEKPGCAIAISGWDIERLDFPVVPGRPEPRAERLKSIRDFPYRWRRIYQKFNEIRLGRKLPKPFRSWLFKSDGYIDIMEGCGGVLVTPDMFDDVAYDIPDKLWTVDDIWLSGIVARREIRVWTNGRGTMPDEQYDVTDALHNSVIDGLNRDEANKACVRYLKDHFGIWPEK